MRFPFFAQKYNNLSKNIRLVSNLANSRLIIQLKRSKRLIGLSAGISLCAGIALYKNYKASTSDTKINKEWLQVDNECEKFDYIQNKVNNDCIDTGKIHNHSLNNAIKNSANTLADIMRINGMPGLSVCVSRHGKIIWSTGMGYADIEQTVPCKASTVMRIASISKPLTMTAVARLMDQGKIDIEETVQTYVTNYPVALYKGKEVVMKVKHILSNTSGIRHYSLWHEKKKPKKEIPEMDKINGNIPDEERVTLKKKSIQSYLWKLQEDEDYNEKDRFNLGEFLIKDNFSSVQESLKLFENDALFAEPGKKFNYTTHGWTLVSAVIEGASGKKFEMVMNEIFDEIGMKSTMFEKSANIIKKRARQYVRTSSGTLENAPYVDNSFKYAGGGILSSAEDLVQFGNVMLYSYQKKNKANQSGYIEKSTIEKMWTASPGTERPSSKARYGLGWFVLSDTPVAGVCPKKPLQIFHTGHAMGGSSVLLITPENEIEENKNALDGVVVAILSNLEGVNMLKAARSISQYFMNVDKYECVVGQLKNSKHSIYRLDQVEGSRFII